MPKMKRGKIGLIKKGAAHPGYPSYKFESAHLKDAEADKAEHGKVHSCGECLMGVYCLQGISQAGGSHERSARTKWLGKGNTGGVFREN